MKSSDLVQLRCLEIIKIGDLCYEKSITQSDQNDNLFSKTIGIF